MQIELNGRKVLPLKEKRDYDNLIKDFRSIVETTLAVVDRKET